jgi:hypothetical protein
MEKTLKSGLVVDATRHYKLLCWKDEKRSEFDLFVNLMNLPTQSISDITDWPTYNELLKFANID